MWSLPALLSYDHMRGSYSTLLGDRRYRFESHKAEEGTESRSPSWELYILNSKSKVSHQQQAYFKREGTLLSSFNEQLFTPPSGVGSGFQIFHG